nr:high frequency lysogenization protein HflD [Pseudoalteromonas sp. MMG010]
MEHQVMALAAMCLAAKQVQKIAQFGSCNEQQFKVLLNSIIEMSPPSPEDIYKDTDSLSDGYKVLHSQLTAGAQKDVEIVKYVSSLMQLERVLNNNKNALNELAKRIDDIHRRLDHFSITDDTVVAGLADIYSSVLSPLGHRIQVYGKPELLKQQHTQNKIRTLLLSGIRAAVLWRQMGGKRRQFFFAKRKILAIANTHI